MKLIRFLLGYAPGRMAAAMVAGLASGAASTALLAVINKQLNAKGPGGQLLWLFVLLLAFAPLARLLSSFLLARLSQQAVHGLRMDLSRRILGSPLRLLEEVASHRLLAAITQDVGAIANALANLPLLLMHLAIVVGALIYLGGLSKSILLVLVSVMVVGGLTYQLPILIAQRRHAQAREKTDELFKHYRSVIHGNKELKLHRPRRRRFLSELDKSGRAVQDLNVGVITIQEASASWGQMLFFLMVGILVFVVPRVSPEVPQETLTGYALVVLFLLTPLEILLDRFPNLLRAEVAFRKIESLGLSLREKDRADDPSTTLEPVAPPDWRELRLAGVSHSYRGEEGEVFTLGPFDLALHPGELIFVIGGNGSGKTTLAKVLLGLYYPQAGHIFLDDQEVTDEGRDEFRQLFSVIFSDFFLFDSLLGLESEDLDRKGREYLQQLRLAHKVRIEDGELSTTDLSQGQRKRLALLTAFLEDRPIYLFDEWAADQDPLFKEFFYRQLLPELRRRGKTAIVISHDDRYYDVADRIVRLEDGQIVFDETADPEHGWEGLDLWHHTSVTAQPALELVAASEPEIAVVEGGSGGSDAPAARTPTEPTPPAPIARPRRSLGRRLLRGTLALLAVLVVGLLLFAVWLTFELRGSLPEVEGEVIAKELSAPVVVARDSLGVPTIEASNRLDVAWAVGFLHAQDRFFQMDLQRRQAAGELSELVGSAAVPDDRQIRTLGLRAVAQRALGAATDEERALIEAYTEGVNEGLNDLGARPFEYVLLFADPKPWSAEDCYLSLLSIWLGLQDAQGRRDSTLGLMHDLLPVELYDFLVPAGTPWDAPLDGPALAMAPVPPPEVEVPQTPARAAALAITGDARGSQEGLEPGVPAGSNAWAVDTAHSADGALLANDMHLTLTVPNLWYRASLRWPGSGESQHRVTGITLPGLPFLLIGSNGAVAWGFTNSLADSTDLVIVEEDPSDAKRYRVPEGSEPFTVRQETLRVRGGDDVTFEVRETRWGPIVGQDRQGRPLALRWTALGRRAVNLEVRGLETAGSVEEALVIAQRSGMPALHFVAADSTGNIGWTVGGRLPRRDGPGGQIPETWSAATPDWDDWLRPEEVPREIDPETGRLWLANSRAVDAGPKIGDGGFLLGARAAQIRDRLLHMETADETKMLALQLDDEALFLARWRDLLLQVLDDEAVAADPARREVRRLVEEWGGHASVDSVGYRIVRSFRLEVSDKVFDYLTEACKEADAKFNYTREVPQYEGPLWTLVSERPPHLLDPAFASWDAMLLQAADDGAAAMMKRGGSLASKTWGQRNTTRIQHPLSLAVPFLARWLDMPGRPLPGDIYMPRVQHPVFGASERMVVSPGHEERGFFHMPGGQSGHPLSPHYRDSLEAWEEGSPTPFLPGPPVHTLRLLPAAGSPPG